jgi:hypothetical protein
MRTIKVILNMYNRFGIKIKPPPEVPITESDREAMQEILREFGIEASERSEDTPTEGAVADGRGPAA